MRERQRVSAYVCFVCEKVCVCVRRERECVCGGTGGGGGGGGDQLQLEHSHCRAYHTRTISPGHMTLT